MSHKKTQYTFRCHRPNPQIWRGGSLGFLGSIGNFVKSIGKGAASVFNGVKDVVTSAIDGTEHVINKIIDTGNKVIDKGLDVVKNTETNLFDTIKKPLIYGAIGLPAAIAIGIIAKVILTKEAKNKTIATIHALYTIDFAGEHNILIRPNRTVFIIFNAIWLSGIIGSIIILIKKKESIFMIFAATSSMLTLQGIIDIAYIAYLRTRKYP